MTGYLLSPSGIRTELPPLFSYSVKHGMGLPCDSFEISCEYGAGLDGALETGTRFVGMNGNEVVFAGVTDEYEVSLGGDGLTLSICGRGYAARLLDNQSEAAVYDCCTIETLIRKHVNTCGIVDVDWEDMGCCHGYSVESGESCWNAVYNFAMYVGRIKPRFSKEGRLILKKQKGESRSFNENSISELRKRQVFHGIISEAVIRDSGGVTRGSVRNEEFCNIGGSARRIITLPRYTFYDLARYTGEYQIARSKEEKEVYIASVSYPFAAFPGDTAQVSVPKLGISGSFDVIATESYGNGNGCGTRITMIRGGGE